VLKYSKQNLPDFIVIGAAKSGTSTLYRYLIKHPDLYIHWKKEIEYFCNEKNYSLGLDWYKEHFITPSNKELCGDMSTTYSRWPHTPDVPERIYKLIPEVKFIYILRHPVERTYSHYLHHMRDGITMTFEEALEKDNIYVDCSKYMMQINHYLRFFPKEKFLVIFLNGLKNNPVETLNKVQDFLEVERVNLVDEQQIVANKASADWYIRKKTTDRIKNMPGGMILRKILPSAVKDKTFHLIRNSKIGTSLEKTYKPQKMLPETRVKLLKFFKEDTSELEKFISLELKDWHE
jgi:hypothetical protein